MYTPVALFTYKRVTVLKRTLESLAKNVGAKCTDLILFSDGPKNSEDEDDVNEVRRYLASVTGFNTVKIVKSEINKGLASSIVEGVSVLLKEYPRIIVLEDDLLTSKHFLEFMNDALELYESDVDVCQICGYSYLEEASTNTISSETYFIKGSDCLAWATWRSAWSNYTDDSTSLLREIIKRKKVKEFNRENSYNYTKMLKMASLGKVSSWAINWYASNFLENKYTLYPLKSLARHIGNDQHATNYQPKKGKDPLDVPVYDGKIDVQRVNLVENEIVSQEFNKFLKRSRGTFFYRLGVWMKKRWNSFVRNSWLKRGKYA